MDQEEYIDEPAPRYGVTSEALVRIEMAKLYQLLLDNELFGDDAGDYDAITTVTDEIKAFVLERLETLIGMRDGSTSHSAPARLPWNQNQVQALTELADTLLARSKAPIVPTPVKPAVNTINKSTPTNRPRPAAPAPQQRPAPRPAAPAPQQRQRTKPATPGAKPLIGSSKQGGNYAGTPGPQETIHRDGDQFAYHRTVDSPLRKPMPTSIEMQGMVIAQLSRGQEFVASGGENAVSDSKNTIGNLLLGGLAPSVETVTQGVD